MAGKKRSTLQDDDHRVKLASNPAYENNSHREARCHVPRKDGRCGRLAESAELEEHRRYR